MGFTPREVDRMSIWEFNCAAAGFAKFHASPPEDEPPPPMSDDRLKELGIEGF